VAGVSPKPICQIGRQKPMVDLEVWCYNQYSVPVPQDKKFVVHFKFYNSYNFGKIINHNMTWMLNMS